ncbi:6-carboxytetrahydropterin synthase [Shouchella lonarensis]|uniref:6-carboxy-5,6,7,8-tetrahydropterin synthase n=1 Tax=Shouchella lonarensis TaxID=1464122 RepID=A0A1G6H6S0_9BACI|nr:6-carboxytetrahydropterin synthase [Shouchella lonarensis]SDB89942.1 preQ(0) biosynthesis protein QueD [Shouchella lonarensis]
MMQQFYPTVTHPYQFELHKDMHLATAHYIDNERAGNCARVHGHTYVINITIAGNELDETGFLINFKHLKEAVHGRFDHTLLNDDPLFAQTPPSTEKVAETIYTIVNDLLTPLAHKPVCIQVIVRETPTSYVVYQPKQVQS